MPPVGSLASRGVSVAAIALLLSASALAQQQPTQPQKAPTSPLGVNTWQTDTKLKATPAPATTSNLDEKQLALVQRVDTYLNEIADLSGRFLQTAPDKKQTKGRFYVKRPGKCRFVYAQPSRQVIVCDGRLVHIEDHDLGTKDSHNLDATPFRLLLGKDINLTKDARILDAQEAEDVAIVTMVDKGGDGVGQIKLFFVKQPALELKEWVITDAQGLDTRIEVSDLDRKPITDPRLFEGMTIGVQNKTSN
ncbi:MAG: outer membrane lipoprotein carrier protein LolA [Hyphomicrobiaceae bacterium]|nr:MAG: outer membrane lipoprotein carrier protein LolA [Hyphomicrobiaceae bacterium]